MYDKTIAANKKLKQKFRLRLAQKREDLLNGRNPANQDFKCAQCGNLVSAERLVAAVSNRNHCPYCLWSRHMDLNKPGDRLSACKQAMPAVALTLKRTRKKYSWELGELMVVHMCPDCGKVSANRIAADDDPEKLWSLFDQSIGLDESSCRRIESAGIHPVEADNYLVVQAQLFGIDLDAMEFLNPSGMGI
ncbi:MAG: RNHCP domain-containing protein [Anaerolineaceae bacterium]